MRLKENHGDLSSAPNRKCDRNLYTSCNFRTAEFCFDLQRASHFRVVHLVIKNNSDMSISVNCEGGYAFIIFIIQMTVNITVNLKFLRNVEFKAVSIVVAMAIFQCPFIFNIYRVA
ncbi:hypothetical protein D3C80_1378610 [compost metagenome]